MQQLGLIGKHLSHSFSQNYFNEKFKKLQVNEFSYELFPISDIGEFQALVSSKPDLLGLNVTIPYKEAIIPYLQELDNSALETGAVNCIKFIREAGHLKLKGYNTDAFGFRESIKPFLEPQHEQALIIGTGGASKAVRFVLKNLGVECFYVSRENKNSSDHVFTYDQLNNSIIAHFKLIVNTTPIGMFPEVETCPKIPFDSISDKHLIYDLIYNPQETLFLKKAKEKGAVTVNGLSMLFHQADKAWEIWTKN